MGGCVGELVRFKRVGAGLDDNGRDDIAEGFAAVGLHVVDGMTDVGVNGLLECVQSSVAVLASAGNRE
jgi:hypothetical protein